jgi:uncharacterized protein YbaP (TraB family)
MEAKKQKKRKICKLETIREKISFLKKSG